MNLSHADFDISFTITGKTDGFGAQYQSKMSGIAYAKKMGYKYIHTPFKEIAHGGDVESLNRFIGIPAEIIPPNIIERPYIHEVHFNSNPSIYYTPEVIEILRNYYYSTPKPTVPSCIAIHIRRGDVDSNMPERFSGNKEYKKIISKLLKEYKDDIIIYSQGKESDFSDLRHKRVFFNLNDSIERTFHAFVEAKVLVVSKSSFSYSAGILNRNKVYYLENFWHYPLKNWEKIP